MKRDKPRTLSHRSAHLREASILRALTLKVMAFPDGINLGQGVCDLEMPRPLRLATVESIFKERATYTPYGGIKPLREVISRRYEERYGLKYSPDDVVVTIGSSMAYTATIMTLLDPGDEIILFEPFYPYHRSAAILAGAKVVTMRLDPPDQPVDFGGLRSLMTDRTRAIVVNTPGQPGREGLDAGRDRRPRARRRGHRRDDRDRRDLRGPRLRRRDPRSAGDAPRALRQDRHDLGRQQVLLDHGVADRLARRAARSRPRDRAGLRRHVRLRAPAAPERRRRRAPRAPGVVLRRAPRGLREAPRAPRGRARGGRVQGPRARGAYYILADYTARYGRIPPTEASFRLLDETHVAAIPGDIFFAENPPPALRFQFAVEEPVIAEVARRLRRRNA